MIDAIVQFFQSGSVLALAVAATIFLITVILVAKRFIGFMITLLLLAFSIAAGYAVLNHDIVREYFTEKWTNVPPRTDRPERPANAPSLKEQVLKAFEDVKDQLGQEKESLDEIMADLKEMFADSIKEEEQKQAEPQQPTQPQAPQQNSR